MLHRQSVLALLTLCALCAAAADVLELRDKAAITGKILAEKSDQVAIDVGYTVLVVPRSHITKITKASETAPAARSKSPPAKPEAASGIYARATAPLVERSVRELVQVLGGAVTQVRTPAGLGSGFFISEDGFLVTNFHVIEGETQITLEVFPIRAGQLDRRVYKQVRIVAINKFADLALLKVEDKDAPRFAKVLLGDSGGLAVGERVFAIGSPLGLERTVTEGIVSTKTRQVQGALYLQTTTQINPGNSGGPLFNLRGEVVGVTNMKLNYAEGLAFAIPADELKRFLDNRDAFAYDNDNPSNAFRYLEPPSRTKQSAPNS